jgi:putative heme-binding domain-containing protein
MNLIRPLFIAALVLFVGVLGRAPSVSAQFGPPPVPHDPHPRTTATTIAQGKQQFEGTCANCHGIDGSGATGPNLHDTGRRLGPEGLFQTVHSGISGSGMPAFGQLGDQKIWAIVDYVSSFGHTEAELLTGDPQKGKAVYESAGCAKCHMIDGKGGDSGPELSKIGPLRGADFLRSALLDPGANLPTDLGLQERAQYPAYLMYRVVTNDGKEVIGMRMNEDSFTIQLKDSDGRIHSIQKFYVKKIEPVPGKSFMPSYKGKLTDEQINDLVSYLAGLGGAQ